jgi:hypothetical protein
VKQNENKGLQNKPTINYEDKCYRCGMKRHMLHTYCMPKKYKKDEIVLLITIILLILEFFLIV